ncbi:hypothetical protein BD560DRAFT_426795 [Blakeslea trispora]|nr:hypothetical protein BD560DRAFT_426795 [Blakeslea trispora]
MSRAFGKRLNRFAVAALKKYTALTEIIFSIFFFLDSHFEATCKVMSNTNLEEVFHLSRKRFKAMKQPDLERVNLTMTGGNGLRDRPHEHTRKKVDMNKSDIGWKYDGQLDMCLSQDSKAMTTNRAS